MGDQCFTGSFFLVVVFEVGLSDQNRIVNPLSSHVLLVHGLLISLFLFLSWPVDSEWVIKGTVGRVLFLLLAGYLVLLQRYLLAIDRERT